LKLINKTQESQQLTLEVSGPPGIDVHLTGARVNAVDAGDVLNLPITLSIAAAQLTAPIITVTFRVCLESRHDCLTQESHFFGPRNQGDPT
jgi:IG-like fold at C-terminal of FixG, putative oxidoreductase